jgi:KDO2-lipid IV(A) lauroyltransferase
MDFEPLGRLMIDLRSRYGTEIIPKQRSMRKLLTSLRANKIIGIMLDQNVDWYEGAFVDFFGRPACTNKGLALVALKTGAPVVPIFSARAKDGRYRIIIDKEVDLIRTGDKLKDVEENTALFTSIIERHIREHPEQYFWFHKRWKTKNHCPPRDTFVNGLVGSSVVTVSFEEEEKAMGVSLKHSKKPQHCVQL